MSVGLGNRFNILEQSPYDVGTCGSSCLSPKASATPAWKPSRYNIRAMTADGRLVLWNSFRGTMSVFEPEQVPLIKRLLRKGIVEGPDTGVVGYLVRRGYLIESEANEYRRIQAGFGQQHYRTDTLELILLASEDCNFRCTYCYEDFARGTMIPSVREGLKRFVEKRLPSLRSLSVGWFGGEPLYGLQAIEDLAPFFLEAAREHELHFTSHMTTNGYLLTPEVAARLLDWNVRGFQITLDGPAETHDQSRPARNGEGTFDRILENLIALREIDESFLVNLRVNFDQKNSPELPRLLATLQEEFQDDSRFRVRFRAVGQWGGDGDDALEVCGTGEADQVVLEMKEEARKRGLRLSDDIRDLQGLGSQVCYAARPYNFIIGATGKVMKCTVDLDQKDRNVVGMLQENGRMELDQDKFALWTEPAFESDGKCKKCVVLPVCQGTFCPQIRMDTGHSPCTPLRRKVKTELREAVVIAGSDARRVTVSPPVGSTEPSGLTT
jgi:uncharacterized protein